MEVSAGRLVPCPDRSEPFSVALPPLPRNLSLYLSTGRGSCLPSFTKVAEGSKRKSLDRGDKSLWRRGGGPLAPVTSAPQVLGGSPERKGVEKRRLSNGTDLGLSGPGTTDYWEFVHKLSKREDPLYKRKMSNTTNSMRLESRFLHYAQSSSPLFQWNLNYYPAVRLGSLNDTRVGTRSGALLHVLFIGSPGEHGPSTVGSTSPFECKWVVNKKWFVM